MQGIHHTIPIPWRRWLDHSCCCCGRRADRGCGGRDRGRGYWHIRQLHFVHCHVCNTMRLDTIAMRNMELTIVWWRAIIVFFWLQFLQSWRRWGCHRARGWWHGRN